MHKKQWAMAPVAPLALDRRGRRLPWPALAATALTCLLVACSPKSEGQAVAPTSAVPVVSEAAKAASVPASAASTAAAPAAVVATRAAASAGTAASASGIALRRSTVQIKFVQMFEQECLPRIAPETKLSPAQRVDFCQCYAAALADHNSEQQLVRYLAGQDAAQLQSDANRYGQPCLERAKRQS